MAVSIFRLAETLTRIISQILPQTIDGSFPSVFSLLLKLDKWFVLLIFKLLFNVKTFNSLIRILQ
jgi:hypothetical protein